MDFKALFTQLSSIYAKLTKQQKIIIMAAIVGIVAFLIFLVVYTDKTKQGDGYKVLFEALSNDDAAKVIEQLEKDNQLKSALDILKALIITNKGNK